MNRKRKSNNVSLPGSLSIIGKDSLGRKVILPTEEARGFTYFRREFRTKKFKFKQDFYSRCKQRVEFYMEAITERLDKFRETQTEIKRQAYLKSRGMA